MAKPRGAWVTLLSTPDYLAGVQVLQRSLLRAQSRYPLVVMVAPAVPTEMRDILRDAGCVVRDVEPVSPAEHLTSKYAWEHFANAWTKLQAFGMLEYDRLVLLDADMLVVRNMDDLFDVALSENQPIAAAPACICNPMHNGSYPPSWKPENCFYTYGDVQAAVRNAQGTLYFNAGLVVLEPTRRIFDDLMEELGGLNDENFPHFAEQDLLNRHFLGRWVPLSYRYNALKTLTVSHPGMWKLSEVNNIHYINEKPWSVRPGLGGVNKVEFQDLYELWWPLRDEWSEPEGAPALSEPKTTPA